MNTIEVWGTTYALGDYPAEITTTVQGEAGMFDTTAAITEIIKGYTNFPARREASSYFPFSTISNVQSANRLTTHGYFFDPRAMQERGVEIESDLYAGALFITSEKSRDGEGRDYTVRYAVPTGAVFALDGARRLDTIDQAHEIVTVIATALQESGLFTT